jgi:superfamily II DNA or RNA helicase
MDPAFSDADHLQLLQLLTRRAMLERRARAAGGEATEIEAEDRPQTESSPDVPRQWRLIPEGISLYGWQEECLRRWFENCRGTVKVATGGGKTLFALAAAQKLQNERERDLRLVIVVPTIPLMFQWYDELRTSNLPPASIGLMGGGQELPPSAGLRILICVLNSARERLPGLVKRARWAKRMMLVVDECHRASAEQAKRIFDAQPKYTLGLSATPEQDLESEGLPSDEAYEKGVVGQALGPIICDFTIKQSLEAGLLTPFEVWHVGLALSPTEASEHARLSLEITDLRKALQIKHRTSRSKQGFLAWCQTQASRCGTSAVEAERFIGLANRRKRLLYRAEARIKLTLEILRESAADTDGRAIVFHESIDEIESLFLQAVDRGLPAVLEHSKLPDSLRAENIGAFRRGVARVIISAKSLVEGFNVPSADLGIIAASSGSVRQRIQSLGRMLRRKSGGRGARIVVLYVRDTEDEAIYEKADWETIVGAERNRYFYWSAGGEGGVWTENLTETLKPPRVYRPSSWEVQTDELRPGEPYPAQSSGIDLKVDQSGNLRTEDGAMVPASPELVAAIVERNRYRRARRTPAGHLIVRTDSGGPDEADWRFLGIVELPDEAARSADTLLRIKSNAGRRVIALEDEQQRGTVHYALGPGQSATPEGGQTRDQLLEWIRRVETERGVVVREIHWDNDRSYWLEINGERIAYGSDLAPLEFKR